MILKTRSGEIEVPEIEPVKVPEIIRERALQLMDVYRIEEVYALLAAQHAESTVAPLRGKVALCSRSRPGVIVSYKLLPWGWSFTGFALDDGPIQWASRDPLVVFESFKDRRDWFVHVASASQAGSAIRERAADSEAEDILTREGA